MTPPDKAMFISRVSALMLEGLSLRKAAARAGGSAPSFIRWKKELDAAGGDPFAAFSPGKPTGRPADLVVEEEVLDIMRWHRLCKGSLPLAVHFASIDPRLSEEVRAQLVAIEHRALEAGKRPNFSPSVRRAFHVTDEEAARFRSRKATHNVEMMTPRGMIWIDEDGEFHDLIPGELWELDDYSANQPYYWTDPAARDQNLGRQVLGSMDVCSGGWLGFDHIGRERDAYRGEDIVRFLGRLFRSHGVPRFLRLERGSWESSYVHGLEVEGMATKWGALDHFCTIRHTWKSKGKGLIESSFNPLQSWLSHTGRDVGRFRGEFELATKAWLQCKQTGRDPRELGFLSADESSAMHEAAAMKMNSRPRDRKALGERVAADDLRARLGWNTTPFPESEAWRLLPYKTRRVVAGGMVGVSPGNGWPQMYFTVNGVSDLHLENGHAVLVAYDPARPDLGAHVANADRSAKNRNSWPMAMPLMTAPLYQAAPQVDLSGRYEGGAIGARRRASAAVATSFRAITAAGRPGGREAMAASGDGLNGAFAGNLPDGTPDIEQAAPAPEAPARGRETALPVIDRGGRLDALRAAEAAALESF
jgi:hypothetical protein